MGWQKIGKRRGERFDPPVVATLQPGATRPKPYGLFNECLNPPVVATLQPVAIDIERLWRSWFSVELLQIVWISLAYPMSESTGL
jgi:hypothetical protein